MFQTLHFLAPFLNAVMVMDTVDDNDNMPFIESLFSENGYKMG